MPSSKIPSLANLPTLGPGEKIGEGDSFIKYDLIAPEKSSSLECEKAFSDTLFELLNTEVTWQKMYHAGGEVPRLVAVQGDIADDGSKPVYRHPSDQSPSMTPFTPSVAIIKEAAERVVGHELNHVLIQLYRHGNDYISEHSDKTLDISRGSKIVNASFGACRTMRLRRKRQTSYPEVVEGAIEPKLGTPRQVQRIAMPHNSIFVLGLKTNRRWLHGINADKRLEREKSEDELAYHGQRISLTFRLIGTFLDAEEKHIWGQGAKRKIREGANPVVSGENGQTEEVIMAFGKENQLDEDFDWESSYGNGFDVLHFRA